MRQIPLSDELGGMYEEKIFIKYDGTSEDLINHEIDAVAYSMSISGYAIFTKKMVEVLFGKDVKVRITAHNDGSFLDIFNISWETVFRVGTLLGIAQFFGIDAKLIGSGTKKVLITVQKKLIKLIIEANGDTDAIIRRIYNSGELTQEEKDLVISIMKDNDVRKGLDAFSSPLDKTGYDIIEVSNDEDKYEVITSQRSAFKYIPPDVIEEKPYQDTVSIIYLSPELSKWKFQGKRIFWADVYDDDFLRRTKDKKFSDLEGKSYFVTGTVRIVRSEGKIKGTPAYTIDKAIEVPESLSLFDT